MKRIVPVAAGLLLAAFALWHPAPRAAGFAAVAAAEPRAPRRRTRAPQTPTQSLVVYVAGAVAHPGLYRLPAGARADSAVRLAGGLRGDADATGVNLAERVTDGEEIAVPRAGDPPRRSTRTRRTRSRMPTPPPAPVDLNTADAQDLARVPGIGPALGRRIAAFRDANGPFAHLDELLDVADMTPARLDRASAYLTLSI